MSEQTKCDPSEVTPSAAELKRIVEEAEREMNKRRMTMGEDFDRRAKFHLMDSLRIMRVDLEEARAVAAEWRERADCLASSADPQWCGFRNEEPKTYAFPWEKTDD